MTDLGETPTSWAVPEGAQGGIHIDCSFEGRPIGYHYHPVFELTLIGGQSGQRLVGDQYQTYERQDLVLLAPDLPHGWTVDDDRAGDRISIAVLFTRDSLGRDLLLRRDARELLQLLADAERGVVFSQRMAMRVESQLRDLLRCTGMRRYLRFLLLLDELVRDQQRETLLPEVHRPRGTAEDYRRLADVIDLMQQGEGETIALADAAEHVDMSVPTFTRFFRRMTGTSFINYLNRWRVERACVLLRASDDSILTISQAVGYANLSHFNRQFRRAIGMTPREFRRNREIAA